MFRTAIHSTSEYAELAEKDNISRLKIASTSLSLFAGKIAIVTVESIQRKLAMPIEGLILHNA